MPTSEISQRFDNLKNLIGNTPMYAIEYLYQGEPRTIYAKAENLNMTGSIKDRMAFHILQRGYETGALQPGTPIAEATSGNTGISVSAIGRALGHPVTIYMPDWMSRERIDLIRSLGADIRLVSAKEGGFLGCIAMTRQLAEKNALFLPDQFANEENSHAHALSTGPEIWWQMRYVRIRPDAFVAGVGTGGTIMGAGAYLRGKIPAIRLHPIEPASSPTLSTGYKVGRHRIQGISDEFIPAIVNLDTLDAIIQVDDGDAIIMAQRLAAELGLAVGISSGANFLGGVKVQNQQGADCVTVTVFADDNKKYLSTDLLKEEQVQPGYLTPDITLLGFRAIKRVCHLACDPLVCANLETKEVQAENVALPDCPLRHRR